MNWLNLDVSTIKIQPLLSTEVLKWQRRHQDHNNFFVTGLIPDASEVTIHIPRIQQVLSILLDNAAKYSVSSFSAVVVMEQSDNFVVVTVKDSGKGIAANEIENICYFLDTSKV